VAVVIVRVVVVVLVVVVEVVVVVVEVVIVVILIVVLVIHLRPSISEPPQEMLQHYSRAHEAGNRVELAIFMVMMMMVQFPLSKV
jgi:hypothetical protein